MSQGFVSNQPLHIDFCIPYAKESMKKQVTKYYEKLKWYPNGIIDPLKEAPRRRRLKNK